MGPIKRSFYCATFTKEQEQILILPAFVGSSTNFTEILYSDEQLKQQVGNLQCSATLLNTSKEIPIFECVAVISTQEGEIKFQFIRGDNYNPITIETELVSGIFKKGTIKLTYVTPDKGTCKLFYKSAE
jgi:hypothetical protein